MHTLSWLDSEQLDWKSFNGFREKLYLKKRKPYSQVMGDESWGQFLSCTYFASAYLTPGASTGLHHHDKVCIVSVVTSGTLTHRDSEGNQIDVTAGQHLVQRTGPAGFKHNESNESDGFTGMLQLWFDESEWLPSERTTIELVEEGAHSRLIGPDGETNIGDMSLAQYHQFDGDLALDETPTLLFCYAGRARLNLSSERECPNLTAGQMVKLNYPCLVSSEDAGLLVIRHRDTS